MLVAYCTVEQPYAGSLLYSGYTGSLYDTRTQSVRKDMTF